MIEFVAHLLNTALALLFWLILGRMVLTLLAGPKPTFFMDLFCRFTDPVYRVVRLATAARVSDRLIPWLSLLLLTLLRLLLLPLLSSAP